MNRFDPKFQDAVVALNEGKITREQAAADLGVPLNTFKTWLRRSNLLEQLEHTRGNVQPRSTPMAQSTPEKTAAYDEAVAECLAAGAPSVRRVAQRYAARGVSYKWLLHKVDRARAAAARRHVQAEPEGATMGA